MTEQRYIVDTTWTLSTVKETLKGYQLLFKTVVMGVSVICLAILIFMPQTSGQYKTREIVCLIILIIFLLISTPIRIQLTYRLGVKNQWDGGVTITIDDSGITVVKKKSSDIITLKYSELTKIEDWPRFYFISGVSRERGVTLIKKDFIEGTPSDCYAFVNSKLFASKNLNNTRR
jgi:hypothetical protein